MRLKSFIPRDFAALPALSEDSAISGAKVLPRRRRKCGVRAADDLLCTIMLDPDIPAASHSSPSLPLVSDTRIVCTRFVTLWLHGSRLRVRRCRPRLAIPSRRVRAEQPTATM